MFLIFIFWPIFTSLSLLRENEASLRPDSSQTETTLRHKPHSKLNHVQLWQSRCMCLPHSGELMPKLRRELIYLWCCNKRFPNTVLNRHGNNLRKPMWDPWIKLYWCFEGSNNTLELISRPIYWPWNLNKYILWEPQWRHVTVLKI